ncbi:hypothetical protein VP1G_09541 [Cytospora mali]|uniref:Thymidylate kinase n=1 Tax=Cytospora mali TaxID=578113 RepID=A0A194VEJ1_CYTMA|nr:hypothetical protein VP1G_09541 [Valsa mali var. pyri (nom. inval.)]
MAAVTRQPFAPLDGSRLQSLTSTRNKQASVPFSSPGKRKVAEVLDVGDFENVDPAILFSKRSKASSSDGYSKDFFKPPSFIITKSISTPAIPISKDGLSIPVFSSPLKGTTSRPRSILNPKSPAKKLNSSVSRGSSAPKSAPAGRSPTRGNKRIGILSRRRTGAFSRVDPPSFNLCGAPFSLDAAIKGTVPSYAARSSSSLKATSSSSSSISLADDLYDSATSLKSSWFFDIHEDTPEQEMTNLLQHSTCLLDISSDEECEQKLRREKAEGRGKENIPPADDVSQTSVRRGTTMSEGGMEYEKPRVALGEMNVEEFYAEGCDPTSVIIVPGDEEDGTVVNGEQSEEPQQEQAALPHSESAPELKVDATSSVEEPSEPEQPAEPETLPTLEPVEGTGESFELWESASAKEEGDGARSPSPMPTSPSSEAGEDLGEEL